MAYGFIHRERPLRSLIPVAFRTGLPWGVYAMGFAGFPVCGENEPYEQPVLFDQSELMAALAHDAAVTAQLPCRIRLFHEVTAVTKLRVLLDVVVIPDGKDDADYRNSKEQGNKDRLVTGTEPPVQTVEYLGEKFVHGYNQKTDRI